MRELAGQVLQSRDQIDELERVARRGLDQVLLVLSGDLLGWTEAMGRDHLARVLVWQRGVELLDTVDDGALGAEVTDERLSVDVLKGDRNTVDGKGRRERVGFDSSCQLFGHGSRQLRREDWNMGGDRGESGERILRGDNMSSSAQTELYRMQKSVQVELR